MNLLAFLYANNNEHFHSFIVQCFKISVYKSLIHQPVSRLQERLAAVTASPDPDPTLAMQMEGESFDLTTTESLHVSMTLGKE